MKIKYWSFLLLLFSSSSFSAEIYGSIKNVYASNNGSVGISLNEPISQELIESECPSFNGYIGSYQMDDFLKSVILSAKIASKNLTLSVSGCEGSWLKLNAAYLKD